MTISLDTANLDDVRRVKTAGPSGAVTTNPSRGDVP